MSMRWRENAVWVALAGACSAAMAWLGLTSFAWNDYENEARSAVEALVHGHLHQFFVLAPVYGGSLLERAPFALVPGLWGGGELAVYRMLALPCLLAAAALGVWLAAWMRRNGVSRLASAMALLLCVANPLTLLALEIGHPDELYGGALCVAAVLLAARRRPVLAGLALGLAIPNKQWAMLAVLPVLIALPGRRVLCMTVAAALTAAFTVPFWLLAGSTFVTNVHGAATSTTGLFQPWQLWWFLGHHTPIAASANGGIQNFRTPPTWVTQVSHPLIVGLAAPLGLAAWLRLRQWDAADGDGLGGGPKTAAGWQAQAASGNAKAAGGWQPQAANGNPEAAGSWQAQAASGNARAAGGRQATALLLLALLLLLRCMLDPWDNIYYPIPFVLALGAWESVHLRRTPALAFAATFAVLFGHHWLGSIASPDVQAVVFAAWTVPLALGLGWTLYRRRAPASGDDRELLGQAGQQLAAAVG